MRPQLPAPRGSGTARGHLERRLRAILLLAGLLPCTSAVSACQSPLRRIVAEDDLDRDEYELVENLHFPEAPSRYGCGAQALAAVLAHQDPLRTAPEFLAAFPWSQEHSTPITLLLAARQQGAEAQLEAGSLSELRASMSRREPLLVLFDSSVSSQLPFLGSSAQIFHWGVVTGIAKDRSTVLLAAPGTGQHYLVPSELFEERWSTTARCVIRVRSR
jgi:ABC-type bacteriocin/lantibiotic exporter with double-glycine peptidase domain